jgi:hypothetical protein
MGDPRSFVMRTMLLPLHPLLHWQIFHKDQ